MNSRTKTVIISIAIIFFLIAFSFFIRAQSADLNAIPAEQRSFYIDSSGLPYFSEMDSYYNLRMTEDFVKNGHFGDTIKDGIQWDLHSYAPLGRSAEFKGAIAYVAIFFQNLYNQYLGDFTIKESAYWVTTIVSSLAAIPAFILVRRITNTYGALTAALLILFAPNYLTHSYAGFFDTDMFNVVLPLFSLLFLIEGTRNKYLLLRIIFILLSVGTLGIFAYSWVGYIFYVAIFGLGLIIFFILGLLLRIKIIEPPKKYSNIVKWFVNQKELFTLILFTFSGLIFLTLINGNISTIFSDLVGLVGVTQTQASVNSLLGTYPNVAISIGELQLASMVSGGPLGAFVSNNNGIVNGVGGVVAFFGALFIFILYGYRVLFRGKSSSSDDKTSKATRKPTVIKKDTGFSFSSLLQYIDNIYYENDPSRTKRESLFLFSILGIWLIINFYATSQGSRFLQSFMIPMGVFTGIFAGFAVNYVKAKVDKKHILFALTVGCGLLIFLPMTQIDFPISLPINFASGWLTATVSTLLVIGIGALCIYGDKYLKNTKLNGISSLNSKKAFVALVIFLALVAPTVSTAYYTTSHVGPGIADPMWNALTWVEKNTVNDTTMASWWDFGYAFEIAADRPTIFDGGSQDGQRAHWIGKAIYTNDSRLSAAILESMATYGNLPFDTLDNYTNDTAKSIKILDNTLPMEKEEAISTMVNEYKLTQAQADKIGELSHPSNPKPVIFVISSDMQGKSYWWSYFGGWNFETLNSTGYSYFYNDQPVEFNKTTGKAVIINSAEQYATVITTLTRNSSNNGSIEGVVSVLNPQTNKTMLDQNGSVYNPFTIYREIVIDDGQFVKNETLNKSGEYTLLIMGSGGFYTAYIMNKELENSMFTKLFILQGFGQDNFEMIQVPKETSGIFLYRVISDTQMFKTGANSTG